MYTGSYNYTAASTTAGITIATPQLDINTVAAGGGSCLTFKGGLLRAGPESAGAVPGPACYRSELLFFVLLMFAEEFRSDVVDHWLLQMRISSWDD